MSDTAEVKCIWVGGPMDGHEQLTTRDDATSMLGQETILGSAQGSHPAVYRSDAVFSNGRLYLRFVRVVEGRKKK